MDSADHRALRSQGPVRFPPGPPTSASTYSDAERTATLIVELRRAMRRANVGVGGFGQVTNAAGRPEPGSSVRVRTPSQLEVLRYLGSHPGAGTNAIATALRLSPNTVSALCSLLVKEGAIRRERDPRDGRAAQFFLHAGLQSNRGQKLDRRVEVLDTALDMLDDEQRQSIRAALPALEQLVESLERIATAPRSGD